MLEASRGLGATIAAVNGGGIRADTIPAGVITDKAVRGVLPFANTVCVVHITGLTLGKVLDNSVSALTASSGTGRFLQLSGARMRFDMARPEGDRAFDIETLLPDGSWAPLSPDAIYAVAVPDFLRYGGDGYGMLETENLLSNDQGPTLSSTLILYLEARKQQGVRPQLLGRVVNATAGARPLVYACHENAVATGRQGSFSDSCAEDRSYTALRWLVEPDTTDIGAPRPVALRLTLRLDAKWLTPAASLPEAPSAANSTVHAEHIVVVPGQPDPDGTGHVYTHR